MESMCCIYFYNDIAKVVSTRFYISIKNMFTAQNNT